MLTTGAMDLKTAEEHALFGGTIGEAHDPNYHAVGNDLGNVNATALTIMMRAQLAGVLALGRMSREGTERGSAAEGTRRPRQRSLHRPSVDRVTVRS